jgi:polyisoprenoid-binding protein YceI
MKLILSLFLFTSFAHGACFELDKKSVSINWSAYKFLSKVGVGGTFKKAEFTSKKDESIDKVVSSAKFNIDASSVFTKDAGRDVKIVKFFFSTLEGGSKISGVVKSANKKSLVASITMNGKTLDIPMDVEIKGLNFSAKGVIDVFDFAMNDELSALNKACYDLHQGKTWSDVSIGIDAKFTKCK